VDEDSAHPGPGASESQPEDRPTPEQPAEAAARKKRFFAIAALVLALVGVVALIWWLHARNYESTDDAYIDAHIVHLAPQIAGRVLRVHVSDNQRVRAGELLVELDPADYRARVNQAQAEEAQAQAQIADAQARIRVSDAAFQQARASALAADAQADNAARDFKRYQGLANTLPAAVAAQQLDQARTTAASTAAQRQAAAGQVKGAEEQIVSAQTQLTAARAQLATAQAQLEQAGLTLGYAQITAPVDGTIAEENVALGNYVQPCQELLAIVPLRVWVTANFKETQLRLMRPGQKVDIRIDAYSGVHFTGHVDSIQRGAGQAFGLLPAQNATGNFVKVVQRVPVKILIDGPADQRYVLGPGMSVIPRVHVR
jgi:membrane fusion protein, multidrug efflux system